MSTATSAEDRYADAQKALNLMLARQAHMVPGDCRECDDLDVYISALRGLITPPATEETPEEIVYVRYLRGNLSAYGEDSYIGTTEQLAALVSAGIQAAWESWEPENAPGVPSGSAEILISEAEIALTLIKESREGEGVDDIIDARDIAEGVLRRMIDLMKKGAPE